MTAPELMQMVRVCREFQKYTGNDDIIVYNIDSKFAPKFHIHPNLLANNFFERRQQFYDALKKVVQNIKDDDELFEYCEDEEVSFMLHHFGIQNVIQKIERYKKKLETKQQTDLNLHKNSNKKSNASGIKQKIKIKAKLSFLDRSQKTPLLLILWCLISLRNEPELQNQSLSLLHKAVFMISTGISIDIHKVKVFKMIQNSTDAQLEKKIKTVGILYKDVDLDSKFVDKKQMILTCNDLRSWTSNGIDGMSIVANDYKHKAIKLVAKQFFNYYDCKLCHYPHKYNSKTNVNYGSQLFAHECISSRIISDKHHYAKTIGVIKICILNDLIERVNELNILSVACSICKEFFIALRMKRCVYKLSNGYIEHDVLTTDHMLKQISYLEGLWWNAKCNSCRLKGSDKKHKACTGCMKVVYCSRRCQKLDWNTQHRNECDRSWKSIYGALKMTILDRM
eukprot:228760_1